MSKNLVILMHPMAGVGNVNSFIGLAEALRSREHKIIFVVDQSVEEMLVKYGFDVEVLNNPDYKSGEQVAYSLISLGILSPFSSIEKLKILIKRDYLANKLNNLLKNEFQLKALLDKHKPDLIIVNSFVHLPTVVYSGKPWVFVLAKSPIVIKEEMLPPRGSGYPTNSDKNGWLEFKQLNQQFFTSDVFKDYLKANGFPLNHDNTTICFSPYLNIYNYPKELDYTDIRTLPDKWVSVDSYIRKGEEAFQMPVQWKGWKGKLIYLSLGSMCSVDIELMKRLVNILSKTKHNFIVSKGLLGDKYELADNMWGEKSVPQTKVLPLVDLVLTHGGHNTVTETLYFGKPMIVLPFFNDHYDNAQRIHEKGFGVRLDPYLCSEEELISSIEMLLNNETLRERLVLASQRIQASNSLERAVDSIESLVN